MSNKEIVTCAVCGAEFERQVIHQTYCSPRCRHEAKMVRERAAYKKEHVSNAEKESKRRKKANQTNMDEIARITKYAWETERLSYGRYVAKHGL